MNIREETVSNGVERKLDLFLRAYALQMIVGLLLLIIFCGLFIRISAAAQVASLNKTPEPTQTPSLTTPPSSGYTTPEPTEDNPHVTPKVPYTIVLDAGHGGFDPGTTGTKTGIHEHYINLAIALKLQTLLENAGYTVIMTRIDDNALANSKEGDMVAREEIITSSNADIFVSIHQNAFDNPDVKGPEVYYNMNSDSGKYLAEYIQNSLDTKLEVVKSRGIRAAEHRLTKYLPYSVLIECGYLTNPAEEALLVSNEYQMKVAEAIFEGINKFFEEFYG